ncbi:MAG: serine hydrolase [Chloroflexi bacterium]|nr:serine hydrolase [Chloroflexota bacterium]MDA1146456.1 serine hydrolase [Chloroflexota bacterium]
MTLSLPSAADEWQAEPAEVAGFSTAGLETFGHWLQEQRSSSFFAIHAGKIFAEQYWTVDDPSPMYAMMLQGSDEAARPIEDVASAQKSVVGLLAVIARERGLLSFDDAVQQHLGPGWSDAPPDAEAAITLHQLLSMTSGLADDFSFVAPAGTVWHYNTPAYQTVVRIVAKEAGTDPNGLLTDWLTAPIGMSHTHWIERSFGAGRHGAMLGLATTARDLGRLGLLVLNGGAWGNERVIAEPALRELVTASQSLNEGYGLLWWLNAADRITRPSAGPDGTTVIDVESPTPLAPAAPRDMVAALGALDRTVYVVPSQELVLVRLGDRPGGEPGGFTSAFWEHLEAARIGG